MVQSDVAKTGRVRREFVAAQFSEHLLDLEAAGALIAHRFGLEKKSLPALRAWVLIDAKNALAAQDINQKFVTDLKLLALQKVRAEEAGQDLSALDAAIRGTAKRLGVPFRSLRAAVDSFAETLKDKETIPSSRSDPSCLPKISDSTKRELRRVLLREIVNSPDCAGEMDAKIAARFGIKETRIPALRAWIGKIFLHDISRQVGARLHEKDYPHVLKLAHDLGTKSVSLDSRQAIEKILECAELCGIRIRETRAILELFLNQF